MNIKFNKSSLALAIIASGFMAGNTLAAQSNGTLDVQLKVENKCKVSGTPSISFGDVSTGNLSDHVDITATIQMDCSSGVTYAIAADNGGYPLTFEGVTRRRMKATSADRYALYDLARANNYQDRLGSNTNERLQNQTGNEFTIYARLLRNQNLTHQDTYKDTVNLTVYY